MNAFFRQSKKSNDFFGLRAHSRQTRLLHTCLLYCLFPSWHYPLVNEKNWCTSVKTGNGAHFDSRSSELWSFSNQYTLKQAYPQCFSFRRNCCHVYCLKSLMINAILNRNLGYKNQCEVNPRPLKTGIKCTKPLFQDQL